MKSLRRTLESRPEYAEWVMQLKVPEYSRDSSPAKIASLQMEIADVVSLCPNLEKLLGAQFPLEQMSDELLNGLRNCKELREHLWLLSSDGTPMARSLSDSFASLHGSWTQLQTLVITGNGSSCVAEVPITRALTLLPSLQRLMLARLPKSAFTDLALRILPPVRSLRLEELPGVTDEGIMQFTREAETLEKLALINMELKNLSTIAQVMRDLKNLWSFTLEQDATSFKSNKCPSFESSSLISIHWDIQKAAPTHPSDSDVAKQASNLVASANASLANAIKEGRFRSLRKLRAPSDDGDLQQACRPRIDISRPTDFILEFPADPSLVEATTATFLPRCALREARKRAQLRIDNARMKRRVKNTPKPPQPVYTIQVSDQNGEVKATQVIPDPNTELGDVSSNVFYDLDPDLEDGYPTPKSSAFVGLDEVLEQWRLETDPLVFCPQSRTDKKKKLKGVDLYLSHEKRSRFLKTCQLGDLFGVVG